MGYGIGMPGLPEKKKKLEKILFSGRDIAFVESIQLIY